MDLVVSQRRFFLVAFCLFTAVGILCAGSIVNAQDPVEAGHDYLSKFPWYEAETESLVDLERKAPGQASSLDRNEQPIYTPPATAAPQAPRNMNAWWMALFSTTMWAVIAVMFLLIIGILVWAFMQMDEKSGSNGVDLDEQERIQERIKQLPFQVSSSTKGDFRDMAWQAAQKADYGKATMLLFSHVLLQLDKNSLIELKRGKTNRQYLRELKSHQNLVDYYQQVMVPFEDSFFGSHNIGKTVFEKCWQELDRFQSEVDQRATTTIATT